MVSVPAMSCEQGVQKQVEVNVPVIDVHELLWSLHLKLGIRTLECKVREYWEHQRNHRVPHAVNFPCSASDMQSSRSGSSGCFLTSVSRSTASLSLASFT